MFIKAKVKTYLKKSPIQADNLEDNQKIFCQPGADYGVQAYTYDPNSKHYKVELASNSGTWYIWSDHWDCSWVEQDKKLPKILIPKDINWSDMSTQITPHFTLGENLQNDPRRVPRDIAVQNHILVIMRELEKIRNDYGKPIKITSGYRPEQINRAMGGVRGSQHIRGTAVDICPVRGDVFEFQKWVDENWYGALGWGAKKNFVHIDCRNGKGWKTGGIKSIRWNY